MKFVKGTVLVPLFGLLALLPSCGGGRCCNVTTCHTPCAEAQPATTTPYAPVEVIVESPTATATAPAATTAAVETAAPTTEEDQAAMEEDFDVDEAPAATAGAAARAIAEKEDIDDADLDETSDTK